MHNKKTIRSIFLYTVKPVYNELSYNLLGNNSYGYNSFGNNSFGNNSFGYNSFGNNSLGYNEFPIITTHIVLTDRIDFFIN